MKNVQNIEEFLDECEVSAGSDWERLVGPSPLGIGRPRSPAAGSGGGQSPTPSPDFGGRIFTVGTENTGWSIWSDGWVVLTLNKAVTTSAWFCLG